MVDFPVLLFFFLKLISDQVAHYFVGVLFGWHRAWRDTHVEQVTQISIESDEPVPYQLDGDPGGELPVTIRVLPGRLTFVGISPTVGS